ncbi:MAG: FtsX-like permease family protein [Anaerolineae bacterium]
MRHSLGFSIGLALRYLWTRRLRTLLTTLAIVFGVMIIFGMNGLAPAILEGYRQNLMIATDQVDLTITSQTRGLFDADRVEMVRSMPGVAHATGSLSRGLVLPSGQIAGSLMLTGLDPVSGEQVRSLEIAEGRALQPGDGNVLLVPVAVAQAADLKVGDTIPLPSASGVTEFEIVGLTGGRPLAGSQELYAPLAAVQAVFNAPGRINTMEVLFEGRADGEAVREAVLAALGEGYKAGGNEGGAEMLAMANMMRPALTIVGVLALVMGGFVIFNTFRTIVVERRHDIGMLRSVGASRRTILGIVLTESLLQGVVGTAAGVAAGYLMATGLVAAIGPVWEEMLHAPLGTPAFGPQTWMLAVGLGVGVSLLAGLQPALSASRVSPLEALRPSTGEEEWRVAKKRAIWSGLLVVAALAGLVSGNLGLAALGSVLFLVGLVLMAPAAIWPIARVFGRLTRLVFAREGQIAQGNVVRQPGRSAVTASAMMIGLAILLAVAGMGASLFGALWGYLDKSLGADYLLMPQSLVLGGGNVGAGPGLAQALREIPGVAAVTTLRQSPSRAGDVDLQVIGIDPETYPQLSGLEFSAGDPEEAYAALATGRALIANGIAAGQLGWRPGQAQSLMTPDGPQTYRVAGIGVDFLNVKAATVYVSQANLAQDFRDTADLLLMANRAPGADAAEVEAALRQAVDDYPTFTLFSSATWRGEMKAQVGALINVAYAVLAVLAVPSLLALVNTLGINVLERTREIGMMRAVGATRKQVRRLILAESLLLTATGMAFGLLAGLWLGYVLVGAINVGGFPVPYSFPLAGILATIAVGLLFGVIGALIPARHAARLDIVAALAYE